jgi:hypothetical protein
MSDARDNQQFGDDYPAAHSMDTTWWGVDQHGHVGKFSTGEAGSVPATIQEPPEESALIEELAGSGAAGVTFYCDDLFREADGKLYQRGWEGRWNDVANNPSEPAANKGHFTGYLLWLRDEAAMHELQLPQTSPSLLKQVTRLFAAAGAPTLQARKTLRLPVPGKVVVWLCGANSSDPPAPAFVRDLLARGIALRAWMYDWYLEVERFGIFAYSMDHFDNWIAGPFEKTSDPPQPLRIEALPEPFRKAAEACALMHADFKRDALIQPFEHGEAHCWGEDWISTTGRRHMTTEFGPDVEGETANGEVRPIPPSITGGETLLSLLATYLQIEPSSTEVLGDYLEEAGQERMAGGESSGERLDEVLLRFFTPNERLALEADFVEHLLATQQVPSDTAQMIRSVIETARQFAAGSATPAALVESATAAFSAWMPQDENEGERGRVAWAAWALARRLPLVAARTARALSAGELAWQTERTLSRIPSAE